MKITIAIRTIAKRREVFEAQMQRLYDTGLANQAHAVVSSEGTGLVPNENGIKTLRLGADTGADWVLALEDDIDFIDDLIGSTERWLKRFAEPSILFYPLGCFYPIDDDMIRRGRIGIAIGSFYGSQGIALRRDDALAYADFLERTVAEKGADHCTRGFDIYMARWHKTVKPEQPGILSPAPSFIDHLDVESTLGYGERGGPGRMLGFRGRDFKFV